MRRQHLHPYWAQTPVRRNADTRMRELERRVTETGDPHDAVRLYWEKVRVEGERESQDFPQYVIDLPRLGPVRLIPQGDAVRVLGVPDPEGRGSLPVVVNRVDYDVSGSYYLIPPYGWIPFSTSHVKETESREQRTVGAGRRILDRFKDPTYRYRNSFHLSRVGWTEYRNSEATDSAYAKFMLAMDRALQAWIQDHPNEMRISRLIAANNAMVSIHDEAAKLRDELLELEAELGRLMLEELRNQA